MVNRFLLSDHHSGSELFHAVKDHIDLQGGTLSVDDSTLDKPYSQTASTELVGYFWSGKHHKSVKGISLVVLVYTMANGYSVPVNYRVYRHSEGKTKNDYFQEMVREVWNQGLRPAWVIADSWYSSLDNLKFLRNLEISIYMGPEKNRIISSQPHLYQQVSQIEVPSEGLHTHLKGFGFIQVFQTVAQDGNVRYYMIYKPQTDLSQPELISKEIFEQVRLQHWQVESFFRCIKQCCQAEKFFVRQTSAIKMHLFSVLRAFQKLASLTHSRYLDSLYSLKQFLFLEAQRQFIHDFA
uniref:Transposase n=1 Tax=Roseihalotalea indica TaxID=2867963 RepID=A0AA49GRN9_9BACT|nr:transposase [Tunicatimonas sp. TK19036]